MGGNPDFAPVDATVTPRFADVATFMRTRRMDIYRDIDLRDLSRSQAGSTSAFLDCHPQFPLRRPLDSDDFQDLLTDIFCI